MSDIDAVAAVLGDRARRNVALGPLTTYRVGGAADLFLEVRDTGDLAVAAEAVQAASVPVLVVGKGSNLLVADRGFRGLALVLGDAFAAIEIDGTTVRAGAAAALPVLARRTAAAGLTGFEWAVGVPGSVGGAVRMNAGGHGSDMSRCLQSADVFDLCEGRRLTLGPAELGYAYRRSSIEPTQVVLGAELGLDAGDKYASEAQITEIVRWRRDNQPGGQNAGSVFTNPPGESAGRLVEACGLKGFRMGSAHVSAKHANFIQADEGGSADDVLALVVEVQRRVEEQTGIRLEPELRLIGFEGGPR